MTKYKTKPIDYTGCNPIIAAHLQRGDAVWCRVWDEDESSKGYVIAYLDTEELSYGVADGSAWANAEPIPQPELRLKKASEIIAECERRWLVFSTGPDSAGWGHDSYGVAIIYAYWLADCGKTKSRFNWPDWAWEEEV